LTDQGNEKGHAGNANDRQEAGQWRIDRSVGQPRPPEAAERNTGIGELDHHPTARGGQRPGPQLGREMQGHPEQAEEERLEGDEDQHDPDAEHVDPADGHR
jgi:hypothetical protein